MFNQEPSPTSISFIAFCMVNFQNATPSKCDYVIITMFHLSQSPNLNRNKLKYEDLKLREQDLFFKIIQFAQFP